MNNFESMSKLLKERGIKNNDFMLKINDKSLLDVDPYSLDLDYSDIFKILNECYSNIWYFIREIVRIRISKYDHAKFQLNLSNMSRIYLYDNNLISWSIQSRRTGTTLTNAVLLLYSYIIKGITPSIIGRTVVGNTEIVELMVNLYGELPWYFKQFLSIEDVNELSNAGHGSVIVDSEFDLVDVDGYTKYYNYLDKINNKIKSPIKLFNSIDNMKYFKEVFINTIDVKSDDSTDNIVLIDSGLPSYIDEDLFKFRNKFFKKWHTNYYDVKDLKSLHRAFYIHYDFKELMNDKVFELMDKTLINEITLRDEMISKYDKDNAH